MPSLEFEAHAPKSLIDQPDSACSLEIMEPINPWQATKLCKYACCSAEKLQAPQPSDFDEKLPESSPGSENVPDEQPYPEPSSKKLPQARTSFCSSVTTFREEADIDRFLFMDLRAILGSANRLESPHENEVKSARHLPSDRFKESCASPL